MEVAGPWYTTVAWLDEAKGGGIISQLLPTIAGLLQHIIAQLLYLDIAQPRSEGALPPWSAVLPKAGHFPLPRVNDIVNAFGAIVTIALQIARLQRRTRLHDVPASSMASSAFICEGVHNFSGQRRLYEQHGGSHRSSSPGAVMSFFAFLSWGVPSEALLLKNARGPVLFRGR